MQKLHFYCCEVTENNPQNIYKFGITKSSGEINVLRVFLLCFVVIFLLLRTYNKSLGKAESEQF